MGAWRSGTGVVLAGVLGLAAPARAELRAVVGVEWTLERQDWVPLVQFSGSPLPDDKLEHMIAGVAIAWTMRRLGVVPWGAMGITAAAALAKEARDTGVVPALGQGEAEWGDVVWTLVGGLVLEGFEAVTGAP